VCCAAGTTVLRPAVLTVPRRASPVHARAVRSAGQCHPRQRVAWLEQPVPHAPASAHAWLAAPISQLRPALLAALCAMHSSARFRALCTFALPRAVRGEREEHRCREYAARLELPVQAASLSAFHAPEPFHAW
jgi:hypothetical protein